MKKRLTLFAFLSVMLINFVSAYTFSLTSLFSSIDSTSLILGLLFVVFFAIFHKIIFMKMFRGSTMTSVVVSFCLATLTIYGLYMSRWDLSGFFYGLGISDDILYIILLVIIALIALFLLWKKKLRFLFLGLGLLLIILALATNFFFEWFTAFIVGVICLALWLFGVLMARRRKKNQSYYDLMGNVGKGAWKGAKAMGKGAMKAKKWNDPRKRLERMDARAEKRQEKAAAKQGIKVAQQELGRRMGHRLMRTAHPIQTRRARQQSERQRKAAIRALKGQINTAKQQRSAIITQMATVTSRAQYKTLKAQKKGMEDYIDELKEQLSQL